MFIEIAAGAFIVGQFVYHRWIEDKPIKKIPSQEVQIPRVDSGRPVPLIYGRGRVRAPLLYWHSGARYSAPSYDMNMFFVLGIPFDNGNGTNRVHNMWAGDWKLDWTDNAPLATGDGGPEGPVIVIGTGKNGEDLGTGLLEFLNGKPTQVLANDGENASNAFTFAGRHMLSAALGGGNLALTRIPGYRGYLSVLLYGSNSGLQWRFGASPTVPSYSFEASSYHTNHPQLGTFCRVGDDSNPINVLYDLLVAYFGKLGIPSSFIDMSNFQQAQFKLHTESHGYSRVIEDAENVEQHIADIEKQIDGVVRYNPVTDKIEIKLVRPDFDPNTIPHITRSNCMALRNFAMGGWANLNNHLRLVYTSRDDDYQDRDLPDTNQANASTIGQNIKNALVLQYPGVTYESLARAILSRELAARSRPIIKFRAMVDRSFIRVLQGDAVKVTWSNPDISGLIFRVARVDHGTLEDGIIGIDLILDFNYTWRNETPQPPAGYDEPSLPGGDLDGGP